MSGSPGGFAHSIYLDFIPIIISARYEKRNARGGDTAAGASHRPLSRRQSMDPRYSCFTFGFGCSIFFAACSTSKPVLVPSAFV
jgi:hypothetical protein